MTAEHACFQMGVVGFFACLGLALVVAALFGWAFIAVTEGWPRDVGRVIAGWRRR